MNTRIVIVEDEQNVIEAIHGMVAMHLDQTEIVGVASEVEEAISLLKIKPADIILLDVHIINGTGFDVLRRIPDLSSKVIFITAHEEYAVRAFEFNALDYLLKPLDPELLKKAVEKAVKSIDLETQSVQLHQLLDKDDHNGSDTYKKIILKTIDSIHLVKLSDIIRCEANRNYTLFHLKEKKPILVSKTLKDYESILYKSGFFRIHQSHLINLSYFDRYEKKEGGKVMLSDGSTLPMSNRKREELMQLLKKLAT